MPSAVLTLTAFLLSEEGRWGRGLLEREGGGLIK